MALVSYDYSSGSEEEQEENEKTSSASVTILEQEPANVVSTANSTDIKEDTKAAENNTNEDTLTEVPELLTHLPESKSSTTITEDKLEDFVPKYQPPPTKEKKPQKVKITIPALSEFEEEEEPEKKIRKTQSKGSSLLAMLPPVKGTPLSTKSFVPNVLKKTTDKQTTNSSLVPNVVRKKAEMAKMAAIKKITKCAPGSDAESDDDVEIPETFDDEMWQKVCGRRTKPKETVQQPVVETKVIDIAPEPVKPYEGLDNAAFKELVGKAKRPVNVKLIDINEEEILPDKNLWMTKSLTDPDIAPKPVIENPVDPTRKKKHHITYLAEQAKANEQELQSQWSASKFTRNQTRAKYGF